MAKGTAPGQDLGTGVNNGPGLSPSTSSDVRRTYIKHGEG